MPQIAAADRFPAREGRACCASLLWPWEALDGSLRTFIGKTRKEDTALVQFTSFGASFRALSGASSDVSEEVSVFRLRRCLGRSVSSQERERNNDE